MTALVQFNAATHRYHVAGKKVPSVTQLISKTLILNFDWVDPWYLEFGTAVHKAVELHIKRELDLKDLDKRLLPYVKAFMAFELDFQGTVDMQILETERIMYDPIIKVAGTMDILATLGNKELCVIDLKSGSPMKWHKLQTAGYSILEGGGDVDPRTLPNRACLYLRKNGTYKFIPHGDIKDIQAFKAIALTHYAQEIYG